MATGPDLAALLEQPTAEEAKYTPRTEFDGTSGFIQTRGLREQPANYVALLTEFGYDPEAVEIVGTPRVSRWQQRARNEDGDFETVWLQAYRFQIRERTLGSNLVQELIDEITSWAPPAKPKKRKKTAGSVFVVQIGDTQWGKDAGDGSEGIAKRWLETVDNAAEAYRRHVDRHGPSPILLAIVGDCLEGNQSQGGTLPLDLTITEQARVYRRSLMHAVRVLAPLTRGLTVAVVNGNHDEAARGDRKTRIDDGWATEGAIAVGDALAMSKAYKHVRVVVPPKEQGYMTIKVGETVFTLAHGHQWSRGKATQWLASQAYYHGGPGAADFLLHGHWHSTSIAVDGPRTIVCSSTIDGGSPWFRDRTGAVSRTGGLAFTAVGPQFHGMEMI